MNAPKIVCTTDYEKFDMHQDNRNVNAARHKKLERSMRKHGFIPSFPVMVSVRDDGKLVIKDGQHRFTLARDLGIPVYYVVDETNIDIAELNSTGTGWQNLDYAEKFRSQGIESYALGLQLVTEYQIPITYAFAMLAGVVNFSNIASAFKAGRFVVKDLDYALSVAELWNDMTHRSKNLKNVRFLKALMMVSRVPEFDPDRLRRCSDLCREKLAHFSTEDAYLAMIEEVYNYHQKAAVRVAIRPEAHRAMRERSAVQVA